MGNVMNLLKIFSLIVSSSAFIVKLYEFIDGVNLLSVNELQKYTLI